MGSLQALAPLVEEDWALEAECRSVQRLVGSLKAAGPITVERAAIHAPHDASGGWHVATPADLESSRSQQRRIPQGADAPRSPADKVPRSPTDNAPRSPLHLAAWTALSLGLALFACGAVLLGWSLLAGREDLWPVGMPLALIGQAGLILGLILQLDGLWHTSRKTAEAITELDSELVRVRQATTLLSTTRTSGAQTFYAHLAEGASPVLLLADLKGQLDLLAQQMARQR